MGSGEGVGRAGGNAGGWVGIRRWGFGGVEGWQQGGNKWVAACGAKGIGVLFWGLIYCARVCVCVWWEQLDGWVAAICECHMLKQPGDVVLKSERTTYATWNCTLCGYCEQLHCLLALVFSVYAMLCYAMLCYAILC